MAIVEKPVSTRKYYKEIREDIKTEIESYTSQIRELEIELKVKRDKVIENNQIYRDNKIYLENYEDFIKNDYINGRLLGVAKSLYYNRSGEYEFVPEFYYLYDYALTVKNIRELKNKVEKLEKVYNVTLKEFNDTVVTFYKGVQKELIKNGHGYVFEGRLGWVAINRVKVIVKRRRRLDYKATKENKAKLLAEGKKLFNLEEANWCKANNIEYDGVDYRVFLNDDYLYEIPLLDCRITNGSLYKLELTDYRGLSVRGKTNEDLIEEYKTVDNILKLDLDTKTKLRICLKIDKLLYYNFIRNESEESYAYK